MSSGAGAPSTPALIVAIDGPAGAGKSSVARRLAERLGVPFVDTGAMYRAAALYFDRHGIDPDDASAIAGVLPELAIELVPRDGAAEIRLEGEPVEARIRNQHIADLTSRAARHPELRRHMVSLQRAFVAEHGGVMEGRDIGTVVVPETPHKFFLEASHETRVARRHAELEARGGQTDREALARQIADRDARDRSRESSPLSAASDALHVATDGLDVDGVVELLRREIERRSVR